MGQLIHTNYLWWMRVFDARVTNAYACAQFSYARFTRVFWDAYFWSALYREEHVNFSSQCDLKFFMIYSMSFGKHKLIPIGWRQLAKTDAFNVWRL